MALAGRESLEAFKRLPFEEQLQRLKDAGILGEDGNLAPRYAGHWTGDEDEPSSLPAK